MNTGVVEGNQLIIDHAYILSDEQVKQLLKDREVVINVTVSGSVLGDEEALEKLERALKRLRMRSSSGARV